MDIRKPDSIISGSQVILVSSDGVYAWMRDGKALYVGNSNNPFRRVANHNIVGKVEAILAGDELHFWKSESWTEGLAFEQQLESFLKPKYSSQLKRGILEERKCVICKKKFKQKRWWQRFCSARCRQGAQL